MKKLLILLIALLISGEGWAATYYVSATGSNTSPYDTPAKAANLPSTAVTAGNSDVGGNGPHTMYVLTGDYADNIALTDSDWEGGSIIGVKNLTTLESADKDDVTLTSTSSIIRVAVDDVTIKNISGTGTTATTGLFYASSGCGEVLLENCHLYDGNKLMYILAGNITSKRNRFEGNTAATADGIRVDGSATIVSSHSIYGQTSNPLSQAGYGIQLTSSGASSFKNDIIAGAYSSEIYLNNAGGSLTIKNCMILGSRLNTAYTVSVSAGTMTEFTNNLVGYNWGPLNRLCNGFTPDATNVLGYSPWFTSPGREGIVVLCIDDIAYSGSGQYISQIEDVLASNGLPGSLFVNTTPTGDTLTNLQTIINEGVFDIQLHGRTHSNWSVTGKIWDVTKGAETVTIDRTADTITLSGGGSVSGFKDKTLGAIKTELEDLGATVTAASIYGSDSSQCKPIIRGEAIADGAATNAVTLKTDDLTGATGYYNDEIKDQYDWMVSTIGVTPTVFAPPGGNSSAGVQTVCRAIGAESVRSSSSQADAEWLLNSIDLGQTSYFSISSLITNSASADQATVEQRTRAIAEFAQNTGALLYLLTHSETECTAAQFGWIVAVLKRYPGIKIMTAKQAVDYIKDSGLWNGSGSPTYTRSWTTLPDYRLTGSSPCINAGSNAVWSGTANVTDYAGRAITNAAGAIVAPGGVVDIGAYEYKPSINNAARFMLLFE